MSTTVKSNTKTTDDVYVAIALIWGASIIFTSKTNITSGRIARGFIEGLFWPLSMPIHAVTSLFESD